MRSATSATSCSHSSVIFEAVAARSASIPYQRLCVVLVLGSKELTWKGLMEVGTREGAKNKGQCGSGMAARSWLDRQGVDQDERLARDMRCSAASR